MTPMRLAALVCCLVAIPAAGADVPPALTATASVAADEIIVGEPIRFWLSIRNSTNDPIKDLRLVGVDAGQMSIAFDSPCGCANCSSLGGCTAFRTVLAGGEQLTMWGHITASTAISPRRLWVLFRWADSSGPRQETAVPIGPVRSTTRARRFALSGYGLLEDLALPIGLIAVAWWFRQWDNQRAERVARSDKRRAEHTETWRQMLTISHGYTINHYMPVVAAAHKAVTQSAKARAAECNDPLMNRRAFHFWMLFWSRMRAQIDVLNGFYFQDRCGEELATALLSRVVELFFEGRSGALERLDAVLQLLDAQGDRSRFVGFAVRWDAESVMQSTVGARVDQEFGSFLTLLCSDAFSEVSNTLEVFAAITRLEMNRVYTLWYGKAERMKMPPDAAAVAWSLLDKAASRGAVTREELSKYLLRNGTPQPKAPQ